jgi:hypothetical protein
MAETKYGKYILKKPLKKSKHAANPWPVVRMEGGRDFQGAPVVMVCGCISTPFVMTTEAHAHDFDQFFVFLGGNPQDMKDFGAEVELSLGEEGGKQIIDSTSVVYIPGGMLHGPLNFKKVDKPIIFMDVALTSTYVRK